MHFSEHLLYIYYVQDMVLVPRNKTLSLPSRGGGGEFFFFKEPTMCQE